MWSSIWLILLSARPLDVVTLSHFVRAILFLVGLYLFLLFRVSTGGHLDVNLVVTQTVTSTRSVVVGR